MRVLVTGGAGFLGRHVVVELLRRDAVDAVEVLDDGSYGDLDALDELPVAVTEASVLDRDVVEAALARSDTVVHLATRWADGAPIADPLGVHEVNATATLRLLDTAASQGVFVVLCPLAVPTGPPRDAVEAATVGVAAALDAARTSRGAHIAEVRLPTVIGPGLPIGHPRGAWVRDRIRDAARRGLDHRRSATDGRVVDATAAAAAVVDAVVSGEAQRSVVAGDELRDLEIAALVSQATGQPVALSGQDFDRPGGWIRPRTEAGVRGALEAMIDEELAGAIRPMWLRRA